MAKITNYGRRAREQAEWIRDIGRPAVIARDGESCACCGSRTADLSVDHIKSKGSRPDLKRTVSNLQLLCFVCHRRKTDGLECLHQLAKVGTL